MVIIVLGLPGSGKSFFASRLAEKLNAVYVNTDEQRFKLFEHRTYSDSEKLAVYDHMLNLMKQAIAENKIIVLDGTFYKVSLREKFEEAAERGGESITYIEVTAPEDLIKERLRKPRSTSEADYEVYLKVKSSAEPLDKEHLILVSSDSNLDEMMQTAIHHLESCR